VSKWDARVQQHAVQGMFATVLTSMESLDAELTELGQEDLLRLEWVVRHVRERLNRSPAVAVPQTTLDQMYQQLNQLQIELNNYTSVRQVAYLGNANTQADALLDHARVLPPLPIEGQSVEMGGYLERVSGMVATLVADAEKDRERLHDAGDALNQQMAATAGQLTVLANNIQAEEAKLERALAVQETQFDRDQADRMAAFRDAEDERAQGAEAVTLKAQEQFAASTEELTTSAVGTLDALGELRRQAEEQVGAIGVAGVAAGYNETAQREGRVADLWRKATVAVALVAAAVLVFALFADHTAAGSWQRLITRLLVSLSFAGVAAYCGRESAAHRAVAREARARHLQLASLNPYLANMPEEEKVRLKSELAPGYFAPVVRPTDGDSTGEHMEGPTTAKLVELVTTLVTKGSGR
jgi:hypothetical protein